MNAPQGGPIGIDAKLEATEEYEGCPSTVYTNSVGEEFRLVWRDGRERSDLGGQTPAPQLIPLSY